MYKFEVNGKTAFVNTIWEMGGGTEGYYVSDADDEVIAEFYLPRGKTPEEEWSYMSEIGKQNVRDEGWDIGKLENAIAAALVHVEFSDTEANELRQKCAKLEKKLRVIFDRFLDGDDLKLNSRELEPLAKKLAEKRLVLTVWDNLTYWTKDSLAVWDSWVIPEK